MKITRRQLRQIIREQLDTSIREEDPAAPWDKPGPARCEGGLPGHEWTGTPGLCVIADLDEYGFYEADTMNSPLQKVSKLFARAAGRNDAGDVDLVVRGTPISDRLYSCAQSQMQSRDPFQGRISMAQAVSNCSELDLEGVDVSWRPPTVNFFDAEGGIHPLSSDESLAREILDALVYVPVRSEIKWQLRRKAEVHDHPDGWQVVTAPADGVVQDIKAKESRRFADGDVLMSLGGSNLVVLPGAGIVKDIIVSPGQTVNKHDVLMWVYMDPTPIEDEIPWRK